MVGPPAVWSEWPRTLERLLPSGHSTRARRPRRTWWAAVSRAVMRWSARIEREPVRVYGLSAALAFGLGVLIGLL